ncbi:MAG: transketolase [Thermoleophilia bacterium]
MTKLAEMNRDELAITTIRTLAMDAVQKANSGHPGMPMGTAPMAHLLWSRHLKYDPAVPDWPDRDRFVLSAGHGSMLLYSLLHLTGYAVSLDDIKSFRQWGSITPGHPENVLTPGVEVTTGPLGQGFANGVGLAMAESFLAATFNREGFPVVDHRVYGIVSDGDLMEGISHEAASLAGHLRLGKLVYFYDSNHISIDGATEQTFTEDVRARFEAYAWHVQYVEDGNDLRALENALTEAIEDPRPSLIVVRTHIGYGSPKQDDAAAHGAPLGEEAVRETKERFGWPSDETFLIPDEAYEAYAEQVRAGRKAREEWERLLAQYREAHPDLAENFDTALAGDLPKGWEEKLPSFSPDDGPMATRSASGKVLNAIAGEIPNLIGGSADLAASNNTYLEGLGDFQPDSRAGRNIFFGVREHAMGAAANGMALHGGIIPYAATFLIFSDYMRPAVRLAALSHAASIFIWTHDSVGLGEDGPTHQPIEHLASLRAMPRMVVIRPADAAETAQAWRVALERKDGPVGLVLTRQKLPVLERGRSGLASAEGLIRGGYVLAETAGDLDVILIATGSEVHVALEAREVLWEGGVGARVVSLPSWELFDEQDADYRAEVLPPDVTARVSIEAAATYGWERYVGSSGRMVGIDRFGASAPGDRVLHELGISVENVVGAARAVLGPSRTADRGGSRR